MLKGFGINQHEVLLINTLLLKQARNVSVTIYYIQTPAFRRTLQLFVINTYFKSTYVTVSMWQQGALFSFVNCDTTALTNIGAIFVALYAFFKSSCVTVTMWQTGVLF